MFSEEITINYIIKCKEEVDIEYKDSMNWQHWMTKLKIIQAMLAMANISDGGVIVIGVKENLDKNFFPEGMLEDDFKSFNYDEVSRIVREYSDPLIEFKLLADIAKIDGEDKKFVVIQVTPSPYPTICIKYGLYDKTAGHHPQNIALRKNAIYIRSKAPIESREIATVHEWHDLIDRLVQKNKKNLLKKLPCSDFLSQKNISTSVNFDNDLTKDNL